LDEPGDFSRANREIRPIDNNAVPVLVDCGDWRAAAANRPVVIATDDSAASWVCGAYLDAEDEHEAGCTQ
jgi:hypothetical protein